MRALIEKNEEYVNIQVVGIDMDVHGRSDITRDMKVRHHSTMVMYRNGKEVGRLIGHVKQGPIEQLMRTTL